MNQYTLYDFFDQERKKPIEIALEEGLSVGSEFSIDDVTYQVSEVKRVAVVRMVKYKIPNTATQFVHKCPAKKGVDQSLDRVDLVKIMKRKLRSCDRVKMQGHMRQRCPHCKTVFWKESFEMPHTIEVPKVFKNKNIIPRRVSREQLD